MRILLALTCAAVAQAACLPVTGEVIRADQLAESNPVFAGLDPLLPMGRAPSPGATRIFRLNELTRLARIYGLDAAGLREVCFEWPLRPPSKERLVEAMRKALGARAPTIEIVEQSEFGIPEGEIVFQPQRIAPAPGPDRSLFLWKGQVRYGDGRTLPVWAKARITAQAERVQARAELAPGEPISEDRIEVVSIPAPWIDDGAVASVEEVAGRSPRVRIEPGRPIRRNELITIPEVTAGERVQVEVRNGPMRILAEGRAGRAGRIGETIPLVNETSGAKFQARVQERGKVVVTLNEVSRANAQ
jgi:flagella basal body P-ring formation protein FlgA